MPLVANNIVIHLYAWKTEMNGDKWDPAKAKRAFERAFQTRSLLEDLQDEREVKLEEIYLVATRAIASTDTSKPNPDPLHYTARLFAVSGRYIGGLHAFPDDVNEIPSFIAGRYEANRRWRRQMFEGLVEEGLIANF
ncbi:hypothetical protein NLJ89_g9592 [Agrocybe chaxingu]|uniref:Uncharacterized protein n=1 Tax=Agrocybe chaxingu TaxID=84603 RepID=A0A9W8MTE4_9AGAR|nr:hypothetical protein NLJ89_g9592 [Agrocybe chaxingu]